MKAGVPHLDDPDTLVLPDQVRSHQADRLLVTTEELKDKLRARGYEPDRVRVTDSAE